MRTINLYAHNATNYDMHIFLKVLNGKDKRIKGIQCVGQNTERFKVFQINRFKFLDSFAFLPCSLDSLTKNLVSGGHSFNLLQKINLFDSHENAKRELLLRKGVFCYDFVTGIKQMKQSLLPKKEQFFSSLTDEHISQDDYDHAEKVYEQFECENLADYMMIYLRLDCFLLAECFLNFRDDIMTQFQLDICRYLSLPSVSLDACLKLTKVKIEKLSNLEMILFVEKGIRGGFSFISERYCKSSKEISANAFNQLSPTEKKKQVSMLYIDRNNLYGEAMCLKLPKSNFYWLRKCQFKKIDWENTDESCDFGYFLEVTLEYESEKNESHSSFPLAPFNMSIDKNTLSPYSRHCHEMIKGRKKTYKANKMCSTFTERNSYIVHSANLKFYLQNGMKLIKIHRVLGFYQEAFLKPYIDHCTRQRKMAKSEGRKNVFKLLNNSLFGKTSEDKRKHTECRVISSVKRAKQLLSEGKCKSFKIINPSLVVIFQVKPVLLLDKPMFIGLAVLELSKLIMYSSYYNEIKPILGPETRVLMSDTDSLILRCIAPSSAYCFRKLKSVMDFSNYPSNNCLYDEERRNELGFFKDECKSKRIREFCGIRSKVYALNVSGRLTSRCKGVKKSFKKELKMKAYKECLYSISVQHVTQLSIRSINHRIHIRKEKRVAFSSFDDKFYVLRCGIHSVPYGSHLTSIYDQNCKMCEDSPEMYAAVKKM